MGEAKATPLTIEREEFVVVRVNNNQENVEVDVAQSRLSYKERENGEFFDQNAVDKHIEGSTDGT